MHKNILLSPNYFAFTYSSYQLRTHMLVHVNTPHTHTTQPTFWLKLRWVAWGTLTTELQPITTLGFKIHTVTTAKCKYDTTIAAGKITFAEYILKCQIYKLIYTKKLTLWYF